MDNLREYFESKFSNSFHVSDVVKENCERLSDNSRFKGVTISKHKVKRYIKQLHSGTSSDMDGVRPEHLKYALNTDLPKYLAVLLTWCIRFGIVPDTFPYGLLVPIIKKPTFTPIFHCSLDAAGAYDDIPHSVLFDSATEVKHFTQFGGNVANRPLVLCMKTTCMKVC